MKQELKYHDENGRFTKAARKLHKKAEEALKPLMKGAKTGLEARERELIIASALSSVRLLHVLNAACAPKRKA